MIKSKSPKTQQAKQELSPSAYSCTLCGITRDRAKRRGFAVRFHRFPRNPALRRKWEAFCGRPGGILLCHGHFEEHCYRAETADKVRHRNKLIKDSLPTIRDPWDQSQLETVLGEAAVQQKSAKKESKNRICFLCRKTTGNHVPIVGETQPNPLESANTIASDLEPYRFSIISKYFSFQLKDMIGEVVCWLCWSKVEEFHLFHEEIEAAHTELAIPFAHIQVKEEVEGGLDLNNEKDEEMLESVVEVKPEQIIGLKDEPENEIEQCEEDTAFPENVEDSSDHEFEPEDVVEEAVPEVPSSKKKKKRTITALHKSDALIAQNCVIICHECSKIFRKFYHLQVHCKEVHKTKGRITCCNRDFVERSQLMEHLYSHDNPELYRCVVCSVQFSGKSNLSRHQVHKHTVYTGTPVHAMTCEKCGKSYTSKSEYDVHMKNHLARETKQFQCKECDKFFTNNSQLKLHVKRHTGTYDYVCETCAKGFHRRDELVAHVKQHESKEKIQCLDCHRWFAKSSMNKHRLIHQATGPVSCPICGKQVANRVALQSHKQFKHREAKYSCTVCDKSFTRAISLREHMTTHNGGALYNCPHCEKTFNSNANMHSHRKKMHYDEWLQGRTQRLNAGNQSVE